jgi:hypothetical protein
MFLGMQVELEEDDAGEPGRGDNDPLQGAVSPLGPNQDWDLGRMTEIRALDGEGLHRIYYDLWRGTHRLGRLPIPRVLGDPVDGAMTGRMVSDRAMLPGRSPSGLPNRFLTRADATIDRVAAARPQRT